MPRHPDPELEQRILDAASRLWGRSGEKGLTMRAVAKAAGTTTPTVYERYRDRNDILRALRLQTRSELFAVVSRAQTLRQACQRQLQFAISHAHAYEVLFDAVAQPPSLHEPWPSFNHMRQLLALRLGGDPADHTRLMLSIWSLVHGTAMLIIRGRFEGSLRTQATSACLDAVDAIVEYAHKTKGKNATGPKWPQNLILGEETESHVGNGEVDASKNQSRRKTKSKK